MPEPTLSPASPPPASAAAAPTLTSTVARPHAEEDVTTSLYRAAIGPVNADFYLPIFARFEAADRAGLSWNTAAGLLTFNWLVYRQLWGAALAYAGIVLALVLLVVGIGRLVFQWSDTLTMALSLGLGLACVVIPGLLGNALFQKECRKRMAKALTAHAVLADARLDLQRQSSSRLRMLWVGMANVAVLGMLAFAYVQLATLNTLTVLPQGALDAGHVAPGLSATGSGPLAVAPAAVISAAVAPALATVSAPEHAASAPLAATAAASAPAADAAAPAPANDLPAPQGAASAPSVAPAPTASAPDAQQPAARASAPQATQPKAPATGATPSASAAQAPRAQPKTAPQPGATAPPKAPPTAKAAPTTPEALYYINVGLFSKPRNAARVHAQLLEAGLPSVMKELKSAKDRQIRVRVGPFATEERAEAAAKKIQSMQFDAGVIQQ